MISISVQSEILNQIKAFTGVSEAIFSDQDGDKPKYPYITLKLLSENGENGQGIYINESVPSEDPEFEYDIEQTKAEMGELTISISAYAKTYEDAINISSECKKWFNFYGSDFLKSKNIVVVSTGTIQNRDALLITTYERRWGFDVICRTTEELKRRLPTIEKCDIQKQ